MAEFLDLTDTEKAILHSLFKGATIEQAAKETGHTVHGVNRCLYRARKREGIVSTLNLVCRFVDEYLGVGEPWWGKGAR